MTTTIVAVSRSGHFLNKLYSLNCEIAKIVGVSSLREPWLRLLASTCKQRECGANYEPSH